jgi:hypothetical protein
MSDKHWSEKPIKGKAQLAKVVEASAACEEVEDFPVAAKFLAALASK